MRRYIYIISVLFLLAACHEPRKEALSLALSEVKHLIDSTGISNKYLLLYELASSDKSSLYILVNSNAPFFPPTREMPTSVTKYKNHVLCYISPYAESVLSKAELQSVTGFLNDVEEGESFQNWWFVAVNSNTKERVVVPINYDDDSWLALRYYRYQPLQKLVFGESSMIPRFFMVGFDIDITDSLFTDSLKNCIAGLDNMEIYYSQMVDTLAVRNSDSYFATINGTDTLKYELKDTLKGQHLVLQSSSNQLFFKNLPAENTWEYLYKLICDSTFFLERQEERLQKEPVSLSAATTMFPIGNSGQHLYNIKCSERFRNINDFFLKWDSLPGYK